MRLAIRVLLNWNYSAFARGDFSLFGRLSQFTGGEIGVREFDNDLQHYAVF
jgi:hypothetical protein